MHLERSGACENRSEAARQRKEFLNIRTMIACVALRVEVVVQVGRSQASTLTNFVPPKSYEKLMATDASTRPSTRN